MADPKYPNRRDKERDSGAQPERNRPDSITQEGKDINTALSHDQRMHGVETSEGHQGSGSDDFQPNKPAEDQGGYGMQDTDRRPADRDNAEGNAQVGASRADGRAWSRGSPCGSRALRGSDRSASRRTPPRCRPSRCGTVLYATSCACT